MLLIPEFFGSRVRFFSSPGSDPVNPDPDPKPSTVLMWIRGFHREKIYQYLWWIRDVDTYVSPSIWIRIKTEVASIIPIIVFYDSMNPDPCECQKLDTKKKLIYFVRFFKPYKFLFVSKYNKEVLMSKDKCKQKMQSTY